MRPPQHGHTVALEQGEVRDVVLRHEVGSGGATSFEIPGATFQLNVDPPRRDDDDELEHAVALALAADVAVVVVGTTEEVESEGFDRESLALPGRQDELVRRVAEANPRTVVVVNAGAPVLLPWAAEVPAVLLAWFPGQEFGNALADVLLGVAEPGGRLPTTWPRDEDGLPSTRPVDGVLPYAEGLFIGHRAYDRDGRDPLYPFGHGSGYTTWEYLGVEPAEDAVRVRVRNTGARARAGGRAGLRLAAGRARSSGRRAGSPASRAWKPIRVKRSRSRSRSRRGHSRTGTAAGGASSPARSRSRPAVRAATSAPSPSSSSRARSADPDPEHRVIDRRAVAGGHRGHRHLQRLEPADHVAPQPSARPLRPQRHDQLVEVPAV